MANFTIAYNLVARWEGGYQATPEDTGNYNSLNQLVGTNWGISAPVYESWKGYPPTKADMQNMSKQEAKAIYKARFWDAIKGDEIKSQALANILFDGRVNHGRTGVKLLQRILNITVDGVFGPITLAAVNSTSASSLYTAYKARREAFYKELANRKPAFKIFLNGWLNRIRSFNDFKAVAAPMGGLAMIISIYLLTKIRSND